MSFADGLKTSSGQEMTTDQLVTEINDKTNFQPSTASASDKEIVIGWGMPDYSKSVEFTTPTGNTWTAPYDCEIRGSVVDGAYNETTGLDLMLGDSTGSRIFYCFSASTQVNSSDSVKVTKGTNLFVNRNGASGKQYFYYSPLKGVQNV